ncbi:MAG: hypothetical protein ACI4LD_03750 [Lentihominibacter sp.]
MIIVTIIFDLMLAFLPFNFAKHMVASSILTDLFGAVPTMDKKPSEVLFEGLLYFAVIVIIELTVISRIEPLRCLAFEPSHYRDKSKREALSAGARTREWIIIAVAFAVFIVLNVLIHAFI